MSNPRAIFAISTSGLANRIHLAASVIRLGPKLKRMPYIVWPECEQLKAPFNSLFMTNWPIAGQDEFQAWLFRTERTTKVYNLGQQFEIAPDDKEDIMAIKSYTAVRLAGESHAEAVAEENRILRALRPVARAIVRVETLLEKARRPLVGFHIRTGDILGRHFCKDFVERKVNSFSNGVDDFMKEASTVIAAGFDILVCSDDVNCERALAALYPGNVIFQEKGLGWRETADGMVEAVVDLFALSRTRAIVGTSGSQFSQLSASLGNIPLFLAGTGQLNLKALR